MKSQSVGTVLRGTGRGALWAAVGLLLVRGLADLVASPEQEAPRAPRGPGGERATETFAVRFARAYLEDPAPGALERFLAAGARIGVGRPPSARGAAVAQAEVVRISPIGDGRAVVTVACDLRDARTLYLAVPIVRFRAGEVAALGAPSIVAVPAVVGVAPERPRPLAGSDAAAITSLVRKFVPVYLAARRAPELTYLLAPGSLVVPLAGALEPRGQVRVSQLGAGEGDRRTLLAAVRVREATGIAEYPLTYRLRVVKRERWYVEQVEGALP